MWPFICLGELCRDSITAHNEALNFDSHLILCSRLKDDSSDVRAAACLYLGRLLSSGPVGLTRNSDPLLLINSGQPNYPWAPQPGTRPPLMSPISDTSRMGGLMPQFGPQHSGLFQLHKS